MRSRGPGNEDASDRVKMALGTRMHCFSIECLRRATNDKGMGRA